MKILLICLSLFLSACEPHPTGLFGSEDLPGFAVQKGSLANHTLMNDALAGVVLEVSKRGCHTMQSVDPYVTELPYGSHGARVWSELWVVKGCEAVYDIEIIFDEIALTSHDYMIL